MPVTSAMAQVVVDDPKTSEPEKAGEDEHGDAVGEIDVDQASVVAGLIALLRWHLCHCCEPLMCKCCCACCSGCCSACCSAWCSRWMRIELYDFWLDGMTWKTAFGNAGGCVGGACFPPRRFFLLRVLFLACWAGVIVESLRFSVQSGEPFYFYWCKLTTWTAWTVLLYLFFAAFSTGMAIFGRIPDGSRCETPWFVSVAWLLSSIATALSIVTTALFWALIYDKAGGKPGVLDVLLHGGNVVLTVIDLLLNHQPYYAFHVWAAVLYSATYSLFTYIFYIAGGTDPSGHRYIYEEVDWSTPDALTFIVIITLVVAPVTYFFTVFLAHWCCRCGRSRALGGEEEEAAQKVEDP